MSPTEAKKQNTHSTVQLYKLPALCTQIHKARKWITIPWVIQPMAYSISWRSYETSAKHHLSDTASHPRRPKSSI